MTVPHERQGDRGYVRGCCKACRTGQDRTGQGWVGVVKAKVGIDKAGRQGRGQRTRIMIKRLTYTLLVTVIAYL